MLPNIPWILDVLSLYILTFLNVGSVLQLMCTLKTVIHTHERGEWWSWWCSWQLAGENPELYESYLCSPGVSSLLSCFFICISSGTHLLPPLAVAVFPRRWGACPWGSVRCGWPLKLSYINHNSVSTDSIVENKIKACVLISLCWVLLQSANNPPNLGGLPYRHFVCHSSSKLVTTG